MLTELERGTGAAREPTSGDRHLPHTRRLILAGTGVAGGALYVVAGFLTQLPGPGDSWTPWIRWARANPPTALGEVAMWVLTVLLLLLFGIYLASVVVSGSRGRRRWLWRALLILLGIRSGMEFVAAALLALPAIGMANVLSPSLANFGAKLFTGSLLPHAIFLTTLGAAILFGGSLWRWVGWFTLGVGVIYDLMPVILALYFFNWLGPIGFALPVYGTIWYLSGPGWPLLTGSALLVRAALKRAS